MRFWVREIAGWVLVVLGLFIFLLCYGLLVGAGTPPRLLEAGPLMFIGIIVFRGGIHLLKVAVAARVCLHAESALQQQETVGRPRPPRDPRFDRLRGR
jgi:hypothetical protein